MCAAGFRGALRPLDKRLTVHPGQMVQVVYEVRNESDAAVAGQAIPSYGPRAAAEYFRKLDCFLLYQAGAESG